MFGALLRWRFAVARVVIGIFLLAAAGLKLHGLTQGPLSQGLLSSPRLQIAAIEVEVVIGLWLLWGGYARTAWWAALGFFTLLAGASAYLGFVGQRSCGCFGVIEVNPWATFGLDLGIVGVLAFSRPRPADGRDGLAMRSLVGTVAAVAVLLGVVAGSFWLLPSRVLARLRGESVTVEPAVSSVGEGVIGDQRSFKITLTNQTAKPVRIVGGTTSCGCIATEDLPIHLPPGESGSIRVQMHFTGTPGRFEHRFQLYTDDDTQPVVTPRFAGRVLSSP